MRLETRSAQRLNCSKFPHSGLVQLVAKIHLGGQGEGYACTISSYSVTTNKLALTTPESRKILLISLDSTDTENNLKSNSALL